MGKEEVILIDSDDEDAPGAQQGPPREAPKAQGGAAAAAGAAEEAFVDLTESQETAPPVQPPPEMPRKRRRTSIGEDDVMIMGELRSSGGASTSNVVDLSRSPPRPALTEKEMRARLAAVEAELEATRRKQLEAERGAMPSHWKPTEEPFFVRQLPLPSDTVDPALSQKRKDAWRREQEEASRVLQRWQGSLESRAIHRVYRIQNKRLWSRYVDRRLEVAEAVDRAAAQSSKEDLIARAASEHLLFHGADLSAIANIVKGGFECRIASMGGALGAGAYFAERAQYSDAFSRTPQSRAQWAAPPTHHGYGYPGGHGQKQGGHGHHLQQATQEFRAAIDVPHGHLVMICARVALGKVGSPTPGGRIAPPGFQSVGQTQTGQIYAVFDNFQAYPEWVIVYDPARVGGQQMAAPPPGAALGAALGAAAGWTGGAMTHSAMAALAGLVTLPPARAPRKGRR